jgi:hypothetical protein
MLIAVIPQDDVHVISHGSNALFLVFLKQNFEAVSQSLGVFIRLVYAECFMQTSTDYSDNVGVGIPGEREVEILEANAHLLFLFFVKLVEASEVECSILPHRWFFMVANGCKEFDKFLLVSKMKPEWTEHVHHLANDLSQPQVDIFNAVLNRAEHHWKVILFNGFNIETAQVVSQDGHCFNSDVGLLIVDQLN